MKKPSQAFFVHTMDQNGTNSIINDIPCQSNKHSHHAVTTYSSIFIFISVHLFLQQNYFSFHLYITFCLSCVFSGYNNEVGPHLLILYELLIVANSSSKYRITKLHFLFTPQPLKHHTHQFSVDGTQFDPPHPNPHIYSSNP